MAPGQEGANSAAGPCLRLDASLRCVGCSDQQGLFLGTPAKAWVGKDFTEFLVGSEREAVVEILTSALDARTGAFLRASFEVEGELYRLEMSVAAVEPMGADDSQLEIRFRDISLSRAGDRCEAVGSAPKTEGGARSECTTRSRRIPRRTRA